MLNINSLSRTGKPEGAFHAEPVSRDYLKTKATSAAGSPEAVLKLKLRSEGPQLNRPGRQAGSGYVNEISAEGATLQRVSRLQRSSNPLNPSRPDGRAYSIAVLRTSYPFAFRRRPLESRRHISREFLFLSCARRGDGDRGFDQIRFTLIQSAEPVRIGHLDGGIPLHLRIDPIFCRFAERAIR
jgi:hypothetical protein